MSAREWKPGDVALVNGKLAFVVPRCPNDLHTHGPHWHIVCGGWNGLDTIHPPRRLAVIDPMDHDDLWAEFQSRREQGINPRRALREAVDAIANPTPPTCGAAINLSGERFGCVESEGHGASHRNPDIEAVWGESQ